MSVHIRSALIVVALLGAITAAHAHAPKIGRNGGPQTNASSFHLEIVPQGTTLAVYLRDHGDRPVPTQGYSGAATFTIEGKWEQIPLVPDGDNKLTGTATLPLPAEPKGTVQITTPTGSTVQGRFVNN